MKITNAVRKKVWYATVVLWAMLLAAALVAPYTSPTVFWFPGFAAIGFLPLLIFGIGLLIIAIVKRRSIGFLIALLLGICIPQLPLLWASHTPAVFSVQKNKGSIRLMQLNAKGLRGYDPTLNHLRNERKAFVDFVRRQAPDIICLQEFADVKGSVLLSNIALLRDSLQYPYVLFQPTYYQQEPWGRTAFGTAIFSRYPLANRGTLALDSKDYTENLVYADVLLPHGAFRVATAHFQSMHLNWELQPDQLPAHLIEDGHFLTGAFFWQKLHHYQQLHVQHAINIRRFCDSSSMPVALCLDMNTLPNSWVYRQVRGTYTDAFLQYGRGIGSSYKSVLPYVRIDYVLADKAFEVKQFGIMPLAISDHHALLCDIQLSRSTKE